MRAHLAKKAESTEETPTTFVSGATQETVSETETPIESSSTKVKFSFPSNARIKVVVERFVGSAAILGAAWFARKSVMNHGGFKAVAGKVLNAVKPHGRAAAVLVVATIALAGLMRKFRAHAAAKKAAVPVSTLTDEQASPNIMAPKRVTNSQRTSSSKTTSTTHPAPVDRIAEAIGATALVGAAWLGVKKVVQHGGFKAVAGTVLGAVKHDRRVQAGLVVATGAALFAGRALKNSKVTITKKLVTKIVRESLQVTGGLTFLGTAGYGFYRLGRIGIKVAMQNKKVAVAALATVATVALAANAYKKRASAKNGAAA